MPMTREEKIAKTNAILVKFCPEMASASAAEGISPYARYPMKRGPWLKPNEKHPETGQYLFQASPDNVGPKPDHVYGKGPFGVGYYHLLTHQPYVILYGKHASSAPTSCCCSSQATKDEYDEWYDVRLLLYKRFKSTRANDAVAEADAMAEARATAQGHYQWGQNTQLVAGAIMNTTSAGL